MLIGKTYWKNIILPKILYGSGVINYTKADIETIQQTENKAYRYIFQAPKHTLVAALRGEVGASSQIARDIKTKFKYAKHLTEEESSPTQFLRTFTKTHSLNGQKQSHISKT